MLLRSPQYTCKIDCFLVKYIGYCWLVLESNYSSNRGFAEYFGESTDLLSAISFFVPACERHHHDVIFSLWLQILVEFLTDYLFKGKSEHPGQLERPCYCTIQLRTAYMYM